jgi:ribonuclease HII|tara:strand:+ start:587 stop:1171 length:585 start_codon:yes stop_codon:yes gene_type:complete
LIIAGVDEAGRGPLAGPVVSAAVILDPNYKLVGLNDSKKLSVIKRKALSDEIKTHSKAWSIGIATVEEIDDLNILGATLLSMKRAIKDLSGVPEKVIVDGQFTPEIDVPCEAIIQGDATEESIMAASIIAKVERDMIMVELDKKYPHYGFSKHKGYPTKLHLQILKKFGPCNDHRQTFKPVKTYLAELSDHGKT